MQISLLPALLLMTLTLLLSLFPQTQAQAQQAQWPQKTYYRSIEANGYQVFYREAGDPSRPTLLLLHGYPASSHAYRELIPLLSGHFHIIAPDNLGSGYSDKPNPETTRYSFDLLAETMAAMTKALGLKHYVLYMQDFGAPVGFRLMMMQPERLSGLIVQNANAYLDGLTAKRQAFFRRAAEDRSPAMVQKLYRVTGPQGVINTQYLRDVQDRKEIMSPDSWSHDLYHLATPEQRNIQVQLFQDYQSNIDAYPKWQAFLRQQQPPTLIVWGKRDPAFIFPGATAYLRDVPKAEVHLLDAGHFAVEEKPVAIAKLIIDFVNQLPNHSH